MSCFSQLGQGESVSQDADFSFRYEGGSADSGGQVNDDEFRAAIQLNGGNWYVSNTVGLTQGLDGIRTFMLNGISTSTVWDSLAVNSAAAAGSKLNFTDSNLSLSSSDLSSVTNVGFYFRAVKTIDPEEISVGVDDFTLNNFEVVPEPSTVAMLLGGFGLLHGFQRARRNRSGV